jgi:cbb3-type cytochrome oxidase maturation protein
VVPLRAALAISFSFNLVSKRDGGEVMQILTYLIPISLPLDGATLGAFFWSLRDNQYDGLEGDRQHILNDGWGDGPNP